MNKEALDVAVNLVKRFEGFSSVPYLCPAGYWTIGYGTRCNPNHPMVTELEAQDLLLSRLSQDLATLTLVIGNNGSITSNRIAALLSWIYNLGMGNFKGSTMLKRIKEEEWQAAALECKRWVYGGGKKLPGLVKRRGAEADLLISG